MQVTNVFTFLFQFQCMSCDLQCMKINFQLSCVRKQKYFGFFAYTPKAMAKTKGTMKNAFTVRYGAVWCKQILNDRLAHRITGGKTNYGFSSHFFSFMPLQNKSHLLLFFFISFYFQLQTYLSVIASKNCCLLYYF